MISGGLRRFGGFGFVSRSLVKLPELKRPTAHVWSQTRN